MKTFLKAQRKSIQLSICLLVCIQFFFSCQESNCLDDNTKIRVNLTTLSIECPENQDCLVEYQNKIEIVDHPNLIRPEPEAQFPDPLYTGMHVPENWEEILEEQSGSRACNEPPPSGIVGTPGKGKIDFFGLNSKVENSIFHLAGNNSEVNEIDKIFFLNTCQDKGNDEDRPFLSISVFEGNFDTLSTYYQGLGYAVDGPQGWVVDSVNNEGPRFFTIVSQLGHYVTISESDNTEFVLRFGHKSQTRFIESVNLIQ